MHTYALSSLDERLVDDYGIDILFLAVSPALETSSAWDHTNTGEP